MIKDQLTKSERTLYKCLHGFGVVYILGALYWYVIAKHKEPSTIEEVAFILCAVLVLVFGLALKTDTRVIYGISWLRR